MKKSFRSCIIITFLLMLLFSSNIYVNATDDDPRDIVYTIKKGDTLWSLGKRYKKNYMAIAVYNNIQNPDLILKGQIIKIPPFANVDNIDLEFIDDPDAIGVWETVDMVDDPSDFKEGIRLHLRKFYDEEFKFRVNGILKVGENPWVSWTKGYVIHSGLYVANTYVIKDIGESKYMFLEWKTGDYVFRDEKPAFYVLKYKVE